MVMIWQVGILILKKTQETKCGLQTVAEWSMCTAGLSLTIARDVGFEVFTAVVLKSIIFWDMTPCSPQSCTRRFGGTSRLHLEQVC
jgi:hypothetical protein